MEDKEMKEKRGQEEGGKRRRKRWSKGSRRVK